MDTSLASPDFERDVPAQRPGPGVPWHSLMVEGGALLHHEAILWDEGPGRQILEMNSLNYMHARMLRGSVQMSAI